MKQSRRHGPPVKAHNFGKAVPPILSLTSQSSGLQYWTLPGIYTRDIQVRWGKII